MFDVKIDSTLKDLWIKDWYWTPYSTTSIYADVVTRKSIRTELTNEALHGIDIMTEDIRNAYLKAPIIEKHYIICVTDFDNEN